MILDDVSNYKRYLNLNINFKKAFDFIVNTDFSRLEDGKVIINDDIIFAIVSRPGSKGLTKPMMESHQKYIDIHFVVTGFETFGWKSLQNCEGKLGDFKVDEDYVLYEEHNFTTFLLYPNTFVIVFPEDVHAPCVSTEGLYKIVLKVKL